MSDDAHSWEIKYGAFLEYRGVQRSMKVLKQRASNRFDLDGEDEHLQYSHDDDLDDLINDIGIERDWRQSFHYDDEILDADIFYSKELYLRYKLGGEIELRDSNLDTNVFTAIKEDEDYEYITTQRPDGLELLFPESLKSKLIKDISDITAERFPANSQLGHLKYDFTPLDPAGHGPSEYVGIIDPFNPALTTIETNDASKIVQRAPAECFRDSLQLNHIGIKKLNNLENVRRYKNNLSTIITDSEGGDYLATVCNSEILLYSFSPLTHLPNPSVILLFDTRAPFTSTTDRLMSTWPYFPHTINHLRSHHFLNEPVLVACLDDSTLKIWFVAGLLKHFILPTEEKKSRTAEEVLQENQRFTNLKVPSNFTLRLESSLWGVDFCTYADPEGNEHNLIVTSDNSQSLTLFYYHVEDGRFYHIKTHQVLHNIPEVSFLSHEVGLSNVHHIQVSCASISGELLIFEFTFSIISGPLDRSESEYFRGLPIYYVDRTMEEMENRTNRHNNIHDSELYTRRFNRVLFSEPYVTSRTLLGEDCWTTKPISSKYFANVQSISEVVGDPFLDEKKIIKDIVNESIILDLEFDPVDTGHLGFAGSWQFLECRTTSLAPLYHDLLTDSSRLTNLDDSYRRIHKGIAKHFSSVTKPSKRSLNGKMYQLELQNSSDEVMFLAVSTSRKLGLFRADTLFCNSSTKRLFDLSIPFNDESKYCNRLSITHLIPKLLCFVVVSQQGLVSFMKLCHYRGVYGMRQEHLFPNALSLALGYNGYRTIAGLAVRERSLSFEVPRYFVYLTYTDGIVIAYELGLNSDHDIVVTQIK